jgi:flavin reductase (DIM6/NTAB) family NADH-FMN oxidoreductase RutF
MNSSQPTRDEFRRTMGRFATGVTIVTTRHGEEVHGMTANAVTSLSLDPMLVLVCVDKTADTHDILLKAGFFAVNILARDQEGLAVKLATKKGDSWSHGLDEVAYSVAQTGAPIIKGSIAYLDCKTLTEHHGGDHTIFIGEVLEAKELGDAPPLLFYTGKFGDFGIG